MANLYDASFGKMKLASYEAGIVKNLDYIPTEIGAYKNNSIYDSSSIFGEKIGYVEFDKIYVNYKCVGRIEKDYILSSSNVRVAKFDGDSIGAAAAAVALGLLDTSDIYKDNLIKNSNYTYVNKEQYQKERKVNHDFLIWKILFGAFILFGVFVLLQEGSSDIPRMIRDSLKYKEIDSDLLFMTLCVSIPTLFLLPIAYGFNDESVGGTWLENIMYIYFCGSFISGIVIVILELFFLDDGIFMIIVGLALIPLILMLIPAILIYIISKCPYGLGIIVWLFTLILTIFMIAFGLIPMYM